MKKQLKDMALSILDLDDEIIKLFSKSLENIKEKIKRCKICNNLTEDDLCEICKDKSRDKK